MVKRNNQRTGMIGGIIAILAFLLALTPAVVGQATSTITGKVTAESTGEALVGANVYVLGTQIGTATNLSGEYELSLPPGTYQIRVTYVSYQSSTVEVSVGSGDTENRDFRLATDLLGSDEVVVIGSRRQGRTVVESAVPIDVFTEAEIRSTGATQTTQVLQQLIPSYNAPRPSITDGTDHMRPATLRGLGPDQVLILINGKRRHTSALVHVNGSIGRGSTGVDLNSIPASAIAKVEVLRDGAAAQYGSDAISGVINIVLKESVGFDAQVTYSQHLSSPVRGYEETEGIKSDNSDAGAEAYSWDGNGAIGAPESVDYTDGKAMNLHLGYGVQTSNGGNVFIAAQLRSRGAANRAGLDPRQQYFDGDSREDSFDRLNHRYGQGEFDDVSIFLNGSMPLGESGTTGYIFGGFNNRVGNTGCFYRRALDNRTVRSIHPDGFLPLMDNTLRDYSATVGIKGSFGTWAYDLSETFGTNSFNFGVSNTNNASFGSTLSQTEFDAGTLRFAQSTTNFDLYNGFDIGTAAPLNVAIGAEFRYDQYKIEQGESASYTNGEVAIEDGPNAGGSAPVGASCFPGFSPRNEQDENRNNFGAYIDLENNLTAQFLVAAAARFENYSDFGRTTTFKLAGRFEATSQFALRGAVSTGFRAPSLAQANYSAIATNFIDGVPFEVGTFPVDDPVARALGAQDLEAETSLNLSVGATFTQSNISVTVDAYQIDIDDRIVFTENFTGTGIADFLATRGINANGGRFFTNAVNTQTRGLDIIARIADRLGNGTGRLTVAYNHNETEITNKEDIQTPAALQAYTTRPLFGRNEIGRFEIGQPQDKLNITGNYDMDAWRFMLRTQFYGDVTDLNSGDPVGGVNVRDETFEGKWITDLEVSYTLMQGLALSVGSENIFDVYPEKQLKVNSFNGIFPYDGLIPYGFFGRGIYARLNVNM